VRETLLPYGRQSVDEADIRAVVDVLRSDWLTTGPKVGESEEVFAGRAGALSRFIGGYSAGVVTEHHSPTLIQREAY